MNKKLTCILIFSLLIILIVVMVKKYNIVEIHNPDKIYYFDNNATTFVYEKSILDEITKWINCGNPSNNLHIAGRLARGKIEECRKFVADDLQVEPENILFTGSATEANNIIIQGIIGQYLKKHPTEIYTIITTNFEHPSVLNVFKHYEEVGSNRIDVKIVDIITNKNDPYYGSVSPTDIENAIKYAEHKVILLSVMYANNETGAIQNIAEIGKIAKKYGVFFHSDITQAIGKFVIHPKELNVDSVTFSGHKFHAPKGIGVLYMKKKCEIEKLCYGGEQEKSYRAGTENVAFIVALTMALKIAHTNRDTKTKDLYKLRNYIKKKLNEMDIDVIEPKYGVTPNTLLIIVKGIDTCNKSFAIELSNKYKICAGVSSACQTTHNSHVLEAMKINDKNKDKIIRISMSDYTTKGECEYLIKCIKELVDKHRKNSE